MALTQFLVMVAGHSVLLGGPHLGGADPPVASATVQSVPQPSDAPAGLSLDELIERLPPVGFEGWRDHSADRWVLHPAVEEMKGRLARGATLTSAQWKRALTRTGIVSIRGRWPVDQPVGASAQDSAWLPHTEIRLRPREPGLAELRGGTTLWEWDGNATEWRRREQTCQQLGRLSLGAHHLVFDVEIERGGGVLERDAPPAGVLWTGELSFDLEMVPTLGDAVPPSDTPDLNSAIRRSLGLCIESWAGVGPTAVVVFDADLKTFPSLATTAISAYVEVLRDGKVREEHPLVLRPSERVLASSSVYGGPVQLFTFICLHATPANVPDDPDELAHWSLRVRGSSDGILNLWHADHYWSGRFECPLAEVVGLERDRMTGRKGRSFVWIP